MSQTMTIIGNLAAEPELKFTPNGKACVKFPVATSERYKDLKGQWESRNLTYWNVIAWDRMAENVTESLRKGDKVIVYGKAYTVSWEDKKTGEKRSRMEVTATEVAIGLSKVSAHIQRAEQPDKGGGWGTPAKAVEVGNSWTVPSGEDDIPPF